MRDYPHPDLSLVSDIDWARLAAYIDGEGCIRIAGVKGKTPFSRRVFYVDVTVTNTDIRLCDWLKNIFGGSVQVDTNKSTRNKNWASCGKWNVAARHASNILERCLPYFIVKREQADVALAFQATVLVDRRYGCKGRPIELIQSQQAMKERLQTLKGTASRSRKTVAQPSGTIQ